MDLGESIFRSWLRFTKRRRASSGHEDSNTVYLKDISDRLRYLSLLLSGSLHEIRGGTLKEEAREFLVFPDSISLLPDREKNVELLIFRLVFYLTSLELGFSLQRGSGFKEQFLFSLIMSERVLARMRENYPGIAGMADTLYPALLNTRPKIKIPRSESEALEALAQLRLMNSKELPKEFNFLTSYWYRQEDTALSTTEVNNIFKEMQRFFPAKGELPQPIWLWGFTAEYKPKRAISELPKLKRREGHEIAVNLERTVHIKKWDEPKKDSNPLFHSFEKTESVEDYGGENTADAIEDLTEDEDAMKDLTLGAVIRTTETTRGLLKADVVDEGTEITVEKKSPPENSGLVFTYPEWDFRQRSYRADWCTLYETDQKPGATSGEQQYARVVERNRTREVQEIRASLLRLLSSREARNRQLDGSEIDYDAVLERYADVAAGHSPTERLYLTQRKAIKDVSFLVLLDTSLSTDGYVDGRRILDVEIEAGLILAGAFEGYLDNEVSIAHFNSRTRNDCRFTYLKRFSQPWSRLRKVAGYLEPDGYTRIGPAVRHAAKALLLTKARRKFLLVVSDGKPSDYDQYEGRYGVNDVAQAIREARQLRITTFGLAVEYQPKTRLAEMFGNGRYHVLPKSSLLPGYMADIFLRAIS